ncbi:MAG: hypothetical protein H5T47_04995 [Archaeoglobi archaeon]|nr:hypothetical protein [Candidatus Mnemosynella bozhongmuii]
MKAELRVDGESIPMNDFVQKITGNLIEALLKSLHGVKEEWKEVELRVER